MVLFSLGGLARASVSPTPPMLGFEAVERLLNGPIGEGLEENEAIEHAYGATREAEGYDQPQEAREFFLLKRSPDGRTPLDYSRYRAAIDHSRQMPRYATATEEVLPPTSRSSSADAGALKTWSPLGPGNIGGRTRGLVVDPTDANVIYAGGVAGGIWKTSNGGGSWSPLNDFMGNLAISVLAMDPADRRVIYAGTGEGFFNIDAVRGGGIFKTADAGATWNSIGGTAGDPNFHYVNDIVVSSNNSQRIYAATRAGVFRSLNGGGSWTGPLSGITATNGCTDLVIRTDTGPADTVLAACGAGSSGFQGTVYRNTDAGGSGSWTAVRSVANQGRTSLAIAPSNQNIIYALSASSSTSGNFARGGLLNVARSTDGGATFSTRVDNTSATKLNTLLLSNPREATRDCVGDTNAWLNQGWYDNVIAVDPADPNIVWVGGIDLFRSNDGGATWGHASRWDRNPVVHADQHVIVFHPSYDGTANETMWVGNDGGVFKTTGARAAVSTNSCSPWQTTGISVPWQNLNNRYAVTQFYDGTPYPNGTTYFGGTQDNGTVRGSNITGPNGWTEILGGDGGYVAVDRGNTNTLYAEFPYFDFQKSVDGGSNWSSKTSGIYPNTCGGGNAECFLFITPFTMHAQTSSRLWAGGWYVWRTTDGAENWSRVGAITPGAANNKVSAIDNAPSDGSRLLVGMSAEGQILRLANALTADSTTAWGMATPRSGYVASVAFDPNNANIAYATYSTFGGIHVWKSTDSGATWTGIDGSGQGALPDIPVHSIVVDPTDSQRLYIGTDLGVYVSLDGGASWSVENTGFANVITERLRVNTPIGPRSLFAFTHGRGAFKVALFGAPANDAFADAQTLSGFSGSAPGSNVDASKETLEPSHADNAGGASVWYTWTAPVDGLLTVDTRGSEAGADTLLAIYTGSTVSSLVLPGPEWQNDDEQFITGKTSKVGPVPVTAGTTYRIAVDGHKATNQAPWTGAINVNWSCVHPTEPLLCFSPVPQARPVADFDGDGDTDFSVWRPSSGTWYAFGGLTQQWGISDDVPVPGQYDVDAATDIAAWRPSNGFWYVHEGATQQWGIATDVPVPCDYDGDGDSEFAVWRPADGTWYVFGGATQQWGSSGDIPVPGDYDGDGDCDFAVWRPSNGTWYVFGGATQQWGISSDVPVPGQYDTDAATEFAVWRPGDGSWYVFGGATQQWGISSDVPAAGDYDGDGDTEFAAWRPSSGFWYVFGGASQQWGISSDKPLPPLPSISRLLFP